jgi:hypothetical protein
VSLRASTCRRCSITSISRSKLLVLSAWWKFPPMVQTFTSLSCPFILWCI